MQQQSYRKATRCTQNEKGTQAGGENASPDCEAIFCPESTQGPGRDRPAHSRLSTPDFTGSGSHWDEEVGGRKMGSSVLVPLGRASVVAVVTGLNRASYFSALAKQCFSAQERLEQGFPRPL